MDEEVSELFSVFGGECIPRKKDLSVFGKIYGKGEASAKMLGQDNQRAV